MADSTLSAIRTKVRRLTRSLSEAQLTTDQIDEYINTFVLYDFPEHLRLFNLKETFSFYLEPYIDSYTTNTADAADPLYEFKNKYITVHQPVYIAGYEVGFFEDRTTFYRNYPLTNSIASTGNTGDAAETAFTGTVTNMSGTVSGSILLRNNVLFSSLDADYNGLSMIDYPISASIGNLYVPGGAPTSTAVQDANNYINYLTGQFVVTFDAAPGTGEDIASQTILTSQSRPISMLFSHDTFTFRPVPEQVYKVQLEVYKRPTELLTAATEPYLQEWWQYISYGAARKVFQDRMDQESLSVIEPEYRKQEMLIQRRTLVQQTSQRTATIYSDNANPAGAYGAGWSEGGGL